MPQLVCEGDVVAGKYRVDRVLGRGGMGIVFAATHLQLDERVAIKLMLPEAAKDPELVRRFVVEARAARMLKSEHVARVHDVGALEDGTPYIVMEFLEGEDLGSLIERKVKIPVEEAAGFVLQACDAIGEAHALDIVHRDIKPSNLFLIEGADGAPVIKVLDFGISKVGGLHETGLSITRTSAIIGSPIYMSPEQMKSAKGVDSRGDVWSLGVILFELVAGRPPYTAETLGALMSMVLSEAPPPLESICPDVPLGYAEIVAACLLRDRTKRPSVAELAGRLAPFAPAAVRPLAARIAAIALKATDPRSARTLPGIQGIKAPQSTSQPRVVALAPATAKTSQPSQTSTSWGDEKKTHSRRTGRVAVAVGGIAVAATALAFALNALLGHAHPSASSGAATSIALGASTTPSAASIDPKMPDRGVPSQADPAGSPEVATSASAASAPLAIASHAPPHASAQPPPSASIATTAPPPQPSATAAIASTSKPPPLGSARSGIFDRN